MVEPDPPVSQSVSMATSVVSSPPRASPLRRTRGPPMGMRNPLKSSCYLNSVLQCLTFTPPLAEYCQRKLHSTTCTLWAVGNCTFCILEGRIRMSLLADGQVDTPIMLHQQVINNSDLFERGRHEDAHELLSFLINDCGKAFESENNRPGSRKTVLGGLFGGVLQSNIECRQCNAVSTKHDDMLDISVDICKLSSLAQAFACFFRPEVLDGDNKYRCGRCNNLSVARKRMSIYEAPKVLTIQLKRFDPLSGKKLNHHVHFEERLSVADCLSKKFTEGPVPHYTLYAVIEHQGRSLVFGHYVAAVKETNGKWYVCNDDDVSEVSEEQVLKANAYILFYIRSDVTVSAIV